MSKRENKEERILITKVSGECRNLRFMDDNAELAGIEPGYYCAAYTHGGWEKIDPKECETCTKEKHLTGISRQEAIDIMAEGMCNRATEAIKSKETVVFDFGFYAEAALNALLEGVKK